MKRSGTIVLRPRQRSGLVDLVRECTDAAERTRALIVLRSAEGWTRPRIAAALSCSVGLVGRVRRRWSQEQAAGLVDRREDNGDRKVTDAYVEILLWVLSLSPPDFNHRRPTWTQPLLVQTAEKYTGVRISVSRMSRLLKELKVRRGNPKPLAPCPWSQRARTRRMNLIHRLIDTLPPDQAAVWEDEADLDLNPRIGPDWTLPGTQRTVMTPGKNVKRYTAAVLDATTDRLTWVMGQKKDSGLFIALLRRLLSVYADARVIHVILDNYVIHSSRRTQAWLKEHGARIRLHFLPPYCPDDNRIERCVFREMHANVTRNHRCEEIEELVHEVSVYFRSRNRRVAGCTVKELRKAI